MKDLDAKITDWMTKNPGMLCITSYTGIGLYAWKCTVNTSDGTEWVRGTGEIELDAKHRAFTTLFAMMPAQKVSSRGR